MIQIAAKSYCLPLHQIFIHNLIENKSFSTQKTSLTWKFKTKFTI